MRRKFLGWIPAPHETARTARGGAHLLSVTSLLLLVLALAAGAVLQRADRPDRQPLSGDLVLLLAAVASLTGMARTLPPQNAVAVGAISAVIGFLAAWLSNLAGFPLGRRVYPGGLAWSIDGVPLAWAFLWVTVVVLGQGLARLLLRPWRGSLHHGLWLMVAGVLLAMHLELGLEPFAVRVAGWWHYQKLPGVPHWYSAPVVNVLGWGLTALAAWLATFPWFLRKQLGDPPRDGFFLALWLVIQTWLIGEAVAHRLWLAAVVTAAGIVVVTVVAMHALRHAKSEGD